MFHAELQKKCLHCQSHGSTYMVVHFYFAAGTFFYDRDFNFFHM